MMDENYLFPRDTRLLIGATLEIYRLVIHTIMLWL